MEVVKWILPFEIWRGSLGQNRYPMVPGDFPNLGFENKREIMS